MATLFISRFIQESVISPGMHDDFTSRLDVNPLTFLYSADLSAILFYVFLKFNAEDKTEGSD